MTSLADGIALFLRLTGFASLTPGHALMLAIACLLLFLAIQKGFEPLLLVPIGFGLLLSNLPATDIFDAGGSSTTFTSG